MSETRYQVGSRVIAAKPGNYEWPGTVIQTDLGGPLGRSYYRVKPDDEAMAVKAMGPRNADNAMWFEEAELKPDDGSVDVARGGPGG